MRASHTSDLFVLEKGDGSGVCVCVKERGVGERERETKRVRRS